MRRFTIPLALLLALFYLSVSPAWGVDRVVDPVNGPYYTIQSAINACSPSNDIVCVKPGTYNEDIDFLGKTVQVRSSVSGSSSNFDIAPKSTFIVGTGSGSVVTIGSSENFPMLTGFTIQNGATTQGGGVYCSGITNGFITHNVICDNIANDGAGIYLYNCSPAIVTNLIIHNETYNYGHGGGVFMDYDCEPDLFNNTIYDNQAFHGAGIYCTSNDSNYRCAPYVANTIVYENIIYPANGSGESFCLWGNSDMYVHCSYIDEDKGYTLPACNFYDDKNTADFDYDIEFPEFVDAPNDNFDLLWSSPLINRGDNDDTISIWDIDGQGSYRKTMGTTDLGAEEYHGAHLLSANKFTLTSATDTVTFSLNAGIANAGRDYYLLASMNVKPGVSYYNTIPGTALPGGLAVLRLNWDILTDIIVGAFPPGFAGQLDANGQATVPVAFGTLDPGTNFMTYWGFLSNDPVFDLVSNPIQVEIDYP